MGESPPRAEMSPLRPRQTVQHLANSAADCSWVSGPSQNQKNLPACSQPKLPLQNGEMLNLGVVCVVQQKLMDTGL